MHSGIRYNDKKNKKENIRKEKGAKSIQGGIFLKVRGKIQIYETHLQG